MITAIITLYKPNCEVGKNIDLISEQADRVIICDNSPEDNKKLFLKNDKITYIFEEKNLALSVAFNSVLRDKSFNWKKDDYIIFFDQDSKINENHIKLLIDEYEGLEDMGYNVGCIGPLYYDRNNDSVSIPKIKKQISENSYIVDNNITSSLLCKYNKLENIGFWNEDIFLDLADWDLCWRMIKNGFICFRTKTVILNHALGMGEKKIGPIKIRKGASIRVYYQTRNYLYLLKKAYTPIRFKLRFIFNLLIRPFIHLLFLNDRRERFKYVICGYRDYFNGITGEYPDGNLH